MKVLGQFQFPHPRFSIPKYGIMVAVVQDKPTSEELRLEAERLRKTADKLIEYAATLIAKATELEKEIARLNSEHPNKSRAS